MKFLAILKDSFREAIDSKVFFVTLGLSLLAVLITASMRLDANPPDTGLQSLVNHFPDGGVSFAFVKVPGYVTYQVNDLDNVNGAARPWEAEYRFKFQASDVIQEGFRLVVLLDSLQRENESAEANAKRKRLMEIQQEAMKKPMDQREQYLFDQLKKELALISKEEMAQFIRKHFERQGNWDVSDVAYLKTDIRKTTKSVEGKEKEIELLDTEFNVTIKSRAGTYRRWPHKLSLLFGAIPLGSSSQPGELVFIVENYLVGTIGGAVIMIISCIITAFFIPNMMRKGTIDLLLAKPMSRILLLAYKYVGGLTFMFLNTVALVVGLWLVIGLRSNIWATGFLMTIFIFTIQFAIFYAVSTLFGVLTRSAIVSILMSVFTWAVLFVVGLFYVFTDATRENHVVADWVYPTVDVIHGILPRYRDFDTLGTKLLYTDLFEPSASERQAIDKTLGSIKWSESILVTALFICVMLALASWRFATRDY
jgi:ABC-type transport system involved in multi-copper enzyme maturation permease subunit